MSDKRIYKLIKLLVILFGLFPEQVLKFFSDLLGLIWYKIDKRHRNVVLKNINYAYPDRFSDVQAQRFAKNNFKHITGILFEVIWSYSKNRDELFKRFSVKGLEHLENAREKGKGVLCLTCHMGNFELLSAAVGKTGMEPYVLYRKLDFKPLERFMREMRQRFGTTVIPLRKASKKINMILKKGGVVGTLLDQNVDWYKGVFADFFGRPACTNNGFAKLVLKTRAPVVPMFIRKENDKHIMEFLPQVPLQITGDTIRDIENNTQNYVSAIESMIRKCPEQYFWVHNRWKTKPYCPLNLS
ncbi:MAG: lysophospholipid acyltransferase family protein [Deltaproteobacteria bacterium]|nr:lysophospholipid acyltransferase family protein [Deltaproteobacteria bacterium]